ncbi:PEP-CTERM sorting domain-containing protein [Paucibacter soli]|uniref:PEP-CTERM sorting domain-containing protein n=1 Tax=Paucibacter soli TaxID=3133433 RepID=UPI0030AD1EC4
MKALLSSISLAAAALCVSMPASAGVVVSFAPSTSHIGIGDSVVINVSISGLGAEILSLVDLNFMFSSTAATRSMADFSSMRSALNLGTPGDEYYDEDVNTAAEFGIFAHTWLDDATMAAGQADNFVLGSFTMLGAFDGVTKISLGPDPDFERLFVGLNAARLDVAIGSACIGVGNGKCEVPEPSSYGLAGVALLAAGMAARKRRRSDACA